MKMCWNFNFCRSCQYFFESLWWSCIEEKFCFDDSIAAYQQHDDESTWSTSIGGGYVNAGASLESLSTPVTKQPLQNNNNYQTSNELDTRNLFGELPIYASEIFEVFSKSMIFKSDDKLSEDSTKSEISKPKPNSYYTGVVSKVTFADNDAKENNDTKKNDIELTDFEIMFQDELLADLHMSKIEEEEEDDTSSKQDQDAEVSDEGICMKEEIDEPSKPNNALETKSEIKIDPVVRADSKSSIKSDSKIFEKSDSKTSLKSEKVLPTKGILKTDKVLPRSDSSSSINKMMPTNKHLIRTSSALLLPSVEPKVFTRCQSRPEGLTIKRVDSLRTIENKNLKNVLSRLPQRSASFLSIADLASEDEPAKAKSHDMLSSSTDGGPVRISTLPDTPVITSNKLPRFFVETPEILEYKEEKTLQSMVTPSVIFPESDFSMPRYYGKSKAITAVRSLEPQVHTSKSLPDLQEALQPGKVNKRLVKLRTRLKPLVIRRSDDSIRTNTQL